MNLDRRAKMKKSATCKHRVDLLNSWRVSQHKMEYQKEWLYLKTHHCQMTHQAKSLGEN